MTNKRGKSMKDIFWILPIGAFLFIVCNWLYERSPISRPDLEYWAPVANADERDTIVAYERAAEKLGVKIKIGYPVWCPAGADYVASLGNKGIYIDRANADKKDKLTYSMSKELESITR